MKGRGRKKFSGHYKIHDSTAGIYISVLYLVGKWVNIFFHLYIKLSIFNQVYHLYLGNFDISKHGY